MKLTGGTGGEGPDEAVWRGCSLCSLASPASDGLGHPQGGGLSPGVAGAAGITAAHQLALATVAVAWGSPAVTLPWKYQ